MSNQQHVCKDCDCFIADKEIPDLGTCRAKPPHVFLNSNNEAVTLSPEVGEQGWCNWWHQREEIDSPSPKDLGLEALGGEHKHEKLHPNDIPGSDEEN